MEEEIKILEERLNEHHTNIFGNKFLVIYEKDIQAIENLLTSYKQLEEENKKLNKMLYLCTPEIPQNNHCKYISYVDIVKKLADSIPTSKVKEKIEEYKACGIEEGDYHIFQEEINALQELLGKE